MKKQDDERIKQPAVAGVFYPDNPGELRAMVEQFLLSHVPNESIINCLPKAIVAPHAGYVYSGAVAGAAYSVLKRLGKHIRRVVILGPAHRVPVQHCAVPSYAAMATPLGNVPIDRDMIKELCALEPTEVVLQDDAFAQEHSLEVQLPFLQACLNNFSIVPILVGGANLVSIARILAELWRGPETLIVVSTDLSHYLNYQDCMNLDLATVEQVCTMRVDRIESKQACGFVPLQGLMHFARSIGLSVRAIDYKNSGDTAGDKNRVVGYGAYHFYTDHEDFGLYSFEQKQILLNIAKQSVVDGLKTHQPLALDLNRLPFNRDHTQDCFVTLEKNGQLRGCIGSIDAHRPLAIDVAENAYKAAFHDPRFPPVTADELNQMTLSISLLSPFYPIECQSELELLAIMRPGIEGVVIQDQGKSALFLPHVWKQLPDRHAFLSALKQKAGFPEHYWSPTMRVLGFTADIIN